MLWELFVQAGPVGAFFRFSRFVKSLEFMETLFELSFFLLGLSISLNNFVSTCYFAVNVYVPKDRVTNLHQGYGFIEFRSEEDADYVSNAGTLALFYPPSYVFILIFHS